LLLVLVLGLPFLVYVTWSAARQAVQEREHARQQMLVAAQLTASRLDDHISNMQQLLATLSHVVGAHAADIGRNDALLRSLQAHVPQHVNNVTVWTRAGENIGSLLPRAPVPFGVADRRYFQEALHARGLVAEAPILSRSNGEPIAVFAFPVLDGDDVVAVVAASTRLRPLQSLLDPKGSLPATAVTSVIDPRGVMLSRSIEPEKWIGRTIPATRVPMATRLQQRMGIE